MGPAARAAMVPGDCSLSNRKVSPSKSGPARSGAHGARAHDPVAEAAKSLLETIDRELGDADFFTREDLLQTTAFGWCATITKYRYIGEAVTRLLETGKLVANSRTELSLPNRLKLYHDPGELAAEYGATVRRLAVNHAKRYPTITVPDLVAAWKTDQHLSTHTKRVTVRNCVARLEREGEISRLAPGLYAMRQEAAAHV